MKFTPVEWGVNLTVFEKVQENSRYVAISSNSIKPLYVKNKGLVNVINSSLVQIIEKPYDLELVLKSKAAKALFAG